MAKKTNKTSHVLNLITGSQPPVQLPVKHSRKDQLLKNR